MSTKPMSTLRLPNSADVYEITDKKAREDKIDKDQGTENAGKLMAVGTDGKASLVNAPVSFDATYDENNKVLVLGGKSEIPGNVSVDPTLSETSTNAIQNQAVARKTNELSTNVTNVKNDLDVLKSRVDVMTSLEEGSTTGDAELQDIRVGTDGTVYDNAGEAVRSQINQLSEEMEEFYKISGTGLSDEQISSLVAIVHAIGVFNVSNGQELMDNFNTAWKVKVSATSITFNVTTLTFITSLTQTITATVEPTDTTDTVIWKSSNESIATVAGGVVTPVSNGSCTITAICGNVSATCEITVNVESAIVTYTVTNNLKNVSTDNPVTTITENSGYTAILTPDTDYELDTVTVTMDGKDITSTAYANGVVTIESVSGNVMITAIANEVESEEVVLLKSITGDGASYIDTEVTPQQLGVDLSCEFSMKCDSWTSGSSTQYHIYGCDRYAVYGPYGRTTAYLQGNQFMGMVTGAYRESGKTIQASDGIWNTGATPSLRIEKQWYKWAFAGDDGLMCATYLDEEMTSIPTSGSATFTVGTIGDSEAFLEELPIEPNYLFAINKGDSTTPSTITLYEFRIKKYSTDELLHEFLPARQGTKIGMYDTVTQKFHENKGTGTFAYEELEVV